MPAAAPRRHERAVAGAILVAAVLASVWILRRPPSDTPVRVVEDHPVQQDEASKTPPSAAAPNIVELIELPDVAPPPAPPSPRPQPSPSHVSPPPASQPITTPPAGTPSMAVALEQPAPVVPAPSRPESAPMQHIAAVEALPVIPLKPEAAPARDILPLAPDPPARPAAAQVQPLRPGDEKPTPKSAAITTPLRPEEPKPEPPAVRVRESERPVERPSPPKMEQVKPAPAAVKPPPGPVIQVSAPPQAAPQDMPKPMSEKDVATEGRVLLTMFEQGAGPSIEIRWPGQAGQRDRLYAIFTHCLGMQVGILDDQGHLYLREGPRDQPLALNTEKYSGFIRRPEGAIATDEQEDIARIRQYHQTVATAPAARMFPRRVDAFLLGGLRQAVGDQYLKMKSIRAAYRLNGNRVVIESIVADGRPVNGAIDLSTVATACSE